MLVRFKSDVGGFTMFGNIAQQLLRLCGHSGTVPGAIPAEDMADSLERLRAALEHAPAPQEAAGEEHDGDKEPPVPLLRRAFPLLELMEKAVAEECGIHWDEP